MPDIVRDDWRLIPNDVLQTEQQQRDAQDWGDKQRAQLAQQWGEAQKASLPPVPLASSAPAIDAGAPSDFSDQSAGVVGASPPLSAPQVAAGPSSSSAPPADLGQPSGRPQTTAEMSGGGAFAGIGGRERDILVQAGNMARQAGYGDEGARALQAILMTEGGMSGAIGDNGQSYGPLQFYTGGQLANFASALGSDQRAAGKYAVANPLAAITWALGTSNQPGYLGRAILTGLKQGLSGPDLATYAQRVGQVSQFPERAGQFHKILFANGQDSFASPITAGAAGAINLNATPADQRVATGQGVANAKEDRQVARPSQFGDPQLSAAEAYAACGPAAAVWAARNQGKNPTLREALDLAKQRGWTPQGGMNGVANEKALLDKMGVASRLETSVDWNKVASDAAGGNPVIISTPGHYFTIDNAQNGKFHVGTSGTDLKRGSEWMSADQIQTVMGNANGVLYVDHPHATGPSVAENTNPDTWQAITPTPKDQLPQQPQDPNFTYNPQDLNYALSSNRPAPQQTPAELQGPIPLKPPTSAQDAAQQAGNIAMNTPKPLLGPGGLGAWDPRIGPPGDEEQGATRGPADEVLASGEARNPFFLHTEPGPGLQPISGEDAASHLEDLHAQYQANDARIQELENQLNGGLTEGRSEANGGVVRPPWAVGWTDDAVRDYARRLGANPYQPDWWPGQAGEAAKAAESGLKGTGAAKVTPAQARQELARLRSENEMISAAADHLIDHSDAPTFYRNSQTVAPGSDLPWYSGGDGAAASEPAANAQAANLSGGPGDQGVAPPSAAASSPTGIPAVDAAATPSVGPRPRSADGIGFPTRSDKLAARGARDQAINAARAGLDVDPEEVAPPGYVPQPESEADQADVLRQLDTHTAQGMDVAGVMPTQAEIDAVFKRLDAGDESALDDLQRIDQQQNSGAPPAQQFDANGNQVSGPGTIPPPNPMQNVTPQGTLAPGVQNIPGKQGGAVPPLGTPPGGKPPKLPTKIVSANQPPPGGGTPPAAAAAPVSRAGITPETIQAAHERIDRAIDVGQFPQENQAAHDQLDTMLSQGAAPDELARFLTSDVERQKLGVTDIIRQERTGSMAGGLTTEGKVALGPIIQTAMRAPVGALKAIVTGKPQDIGRGLQGGLAGLAEGSQDALQTVRYGINYRAALTGGAQGGFGFKPGLDVLGKSAATRAIGTGLTGLVRTHGAISDVSAGIGRGANAALGASPEDAAEAGQQWALRSGQYGVIGSAVAKAFDQLRSTNPALDVVGQILIPFYRVGYNVFTQGVERSPLGLVGRVTDIPTGKGFQGDKLANNMFGVGLAAYAFSQAAQGNITGDAPQNGSPKWSIRVAGNWVPIRTLGPAGEALAQSASLYEAARDRRGNVGQIAERTASEYVAHVYDETWLRSIGDAFGTVADIRDLNNPRTAARAGKDLQYQGSSYGKSFIPQERLGEQLVGAAASSGGLPSGGSQPPRVPPVRSRRRP